MLFLGAGASTPFNKPVTKDFKKLLYQDYPSAVNNGLMYHLLRFEEFEDIEHVLDCAVKLTDYGNTPTGKFLKDLGVKRLLRFQYDKNDGGDRGFETLLSEAENAVNLIKSKILYIYKWDFNFDPVVPQIYTPIFNFLKSHSDSILIATTNYDRAIERFCDQSQYYISDGFEQKYNSFLWTGKFSYPYIGDNTSPVVLYKLHGSLGWKKYVNGTIERSSDDADPTYSQNMLIYPTLCPKKDEDDDPYRSIIYEFGQKLNECDICIIIGYSFRDVSINKFIKQLLVDDKKLIVVDKKAEHNIGTNFLPIISVHQVQGDGVLVEIDGKMKPIELIPEYIEPDNIDNIVEKISLLI